MLSPRFVVPLLLGTLVSRNMAHILLVDDSEVLRETLERALKRRGYTVTTATDGQEALTRLEEAEAVDLVITDILMPGKEGVQTVEELKRRFPDLPVLAMSGGGRSAPEGYLALARAAGATETLSKPFSLQDFLAITTRLLP